MFQEWFPLKARGCRVCMRTCIEPGIRQGSLISLLKDNIEHWCECVDICNHVVDIWLLRSGLFDNGGQLKRPAFSCWVRINRLTRSRKAASKGSNRRHYSQSTDYLCWPLTNKVNDSSSAYYPQCHGLCVRAISRNVLLRLRHSSRYM